MNTVTFCETHRMLYPERVLQAPGVEVLVVDRRQGTQAVEAHTPPSAASTSLNFTLHVLIYFHLYCKYYIKIHTSRATP